MIYFSKENIWFPRHFGSNSTIFLIKLTNLTTKNVVDLEVENISELAGFYVFDFSNVELNDGIYKYEFNGEIGLLQVGNFEPDHTIYEQYNKTTIVYEG